MTSRIETPRRSPALRAGLVMAGAALVAMAIPQVAATGAATVERLTATAVNMSGVGRATVGTLEIGIERWSTDAERDRLLTALREGGSDALMRALQDMPRVGYIRTPTSVAWDLHFARQRELDDDGRQIVFATDRPMSFWEAAAQPRSADYDFMIADIRFDGDGKGVGKLGVATKIRFDRDSGVIELENFGFEPVRLTEVRRVTQATP